MTLMLTLLNGLMSTWQNKVYLGITLENLLPGGEQPASMLTTPLTDQRNQSTYIYVVRTKSPKIKHQSQSLSN